MDAQEKISNLVASDEISKYLDLTAYKQNLYEHGKTASDAIGILSVYLYEIIISKIKFPKVKK